MKRKRFYAMWLIFGFLGASIFANAFAIPFFGFKKFFELFFITAIAYTVYIPFLPYALCRVHKAARGDLNRLKVMLPFHFVLYTTAASFLAVFLFSKDRGSLLYDAMETSVIFGVPALLGGYLLSGLCHLSEGWADRRHWLMND